MNLCQRVTSCQSIMFSLRLNLVQEGRITEVLGHNQMSQNNQKHVTKGHASFYKATFIERLFAHGYD